MMHDFPYTDLHNLNLDWFLEQFKKLSGEFKSLKKSFKDFVAEIENIITFDESVPMEVRQAIFNLLDNNAFANDETYTSDLAVLEAWASEPVATLTGITAVYTQSGIVYNTDSLDSLRNDLVVTASYDNGTTQEVTGYSLSGTLAEGISTITVSYGGYTDTFTVTVTNITGDALYYWDLTSSLVDLVDGNTATLSGGAQTNQGLSLTSDTNYARFPNVVGLNRRIEVDVSDINYQAPNHGRFIMVNKATLASPTVDTGFIWRSTGYWAIFRGPYNTWVNSSFSDTTMFNGKTVSFTIDADGNVTVESDDITIVSTSSPITISSDDSGLYIGSPSGNSLYNLTITGVRVYEVTP